MTLAQINAKIRSEVSEHITLTRDEGYHTLTYDEGPVLDEYIVPTPFTKDLSTADWIDEARFLLAGVTARKEEN